METRDGDQNGDEMPAMLRDRGVGGDEEGPRGGTTRSGASGTVVVVRKRPGHLFVPGLLALAACPR